MKTCAHSESRYTSLIICITALFTAMNIILSYRIFSIPVPGGHLYLNDTIIYIAAFMLNPLCAFVVGGIGSFFGDLLFYPVAMFVSLVTHGLQAAIASYIYHKLYASFKPSNSNKGIIKNPQIKAAIPAVIIGGIIVVLGYTFGKIYVYSTFEYAMIKLPYEIAQGIFVAIATIIVLKKFHLKKFI